MHKNYVNQR